MKKIALILICLALFLTLEALFLDKAIFAVSYLNHPSVDDAQISNSYPIESEPEVVQSSPIEHGRAPEPATLFLFLGGIAGIAARFIRKSYKKFKRYSDLLLATLGTMLSLPFFLLAVILIKLTSKGPIIYRQNRVGQKGEIFGIYKLRTMVVDAEKETGAVWAKENDPRITAIGRVLRKTHIDEIPQLLNVITGEMSIVGPRPERPEMVRNFKNLILDYEKRLQVKPGITGLAQVFHKYDETLDDVKKKIKYDILYIRKMCMLADLRIMAQTCVVVLTGKGAR